MQIDRVLFTCVADLNIQPLEVEEKTDGTRNTLTSVRLGRGPQGRRGAGRGRLHRREFPLFLRPVPAGLTNTKIHLEVLVNCLVNTLHPA